ncbi:serine--tRNA ligase [Patescibacteria group bacterium]|nr:serine--tRNA ligase [Patescibacteria group bacterium]
MLDIKWIRENLDVMRESLKKRGTQANLDILLSWDEQRRKCIKKGDELKHLKNLYSEKISQLKEQSKNPQDIIEKTQKLAFEIKEGEKKRRNFEQRITDFLLNLPNRLHSSVPGGNDNVEEKRWGKLPKFNFSPRDHQQIGEDLNILDFKRAAKITGSGFVVYKGLGARLERALINFMLDLHIPQGYKEILPPFMTNSAAATGTGQLPKFREDLYKCEKDDYYLVPTAEVPITNLHREEILKEEDLPLYYVAYTPCFRREAGAYGKKIKGIIRQHQFNKVELVKFTIPQTSYEELERLLLDAEDVLKKLELPYRVVRLCGKELGFSATFGYDIEVWIPSQKKFLEISTCSNFEDYQSRRASIRYRDKEKGLVRYVHTLNGSGLAIGRTVVAILENFQDEKGRVYIPDVLHSYIKEVKWIEKGGMSELARSRS